MDRRNFIYHTLVAGLPLLFMPKLLANKLTSNSQFKKSNFGSDFIWGAATAAYQTEGAYNLDGKGVSIWDNFTNSHKHSAKKENGNIATDFYNKYTNDLAMLKELNINNFRFSFSWSRIIPNGIGGINQKGIDFYNRLIDCCLEQGITPWPCLYHWDLPQALEDKGGWTNRDILSWFQEYTTTATKAFGDRIENWIIMNEPMVFTSLGYMTGYHAPGRKGIKNYLPAIHHASLCQSLGARRVREELPSSNIGTTFSCSVVEPLDTSEKHVKAARKIDAALNRLFLEPCLGLGYPLDDLPVLKRLEKYMYAGDEDLLKFNFDFHGLQYYFRVIAKHSLKPPLFATELKPKLRNVPVNQMGLEVYPKGIEAMLKKFSAYPGIKKILISESGVCYEDKPGIDSAIHDHQRAKYHQETLESILKSKREGSNAVGYFVWSATDNFEWSEGFEPRFGLIYVDYNTLERTIKDSGYWFQEFLR